MDMVHEEFGTNSQSQGNIGSFLDKIWRVSINSDIQRKEESHIRRQLSKQSLTILRRECQDIFHMLISNLENFEINRSLATHLFLEKEMLMLKSNVLLTQVQTDVSEEKKKQLTEVLVHILEIIAQLDGKEDTSLSVKLHLMQDPSNFLISRLLDPHSLGYAWPFGGLYFSYSIIEEDNKDEVKNDHIFIENATLVGAGIDQDDLSLTNLGPNPHIWKIRGIPIDKRKITISPEHVDVPVYSINHSGELFKVPIKVGKESKQFWERRNIFIQLG